MIWKEFRELSKQIKTRIEELETAKGGITDKLIAKELNKVGLAINNILLNNIEEMGK